MSMVVIERGPDGRWWISRCGWGRPVGPCLARALAEAAAYYPNDEYEVVGPVDLDTP